MTVTYLEEANKPHMPELLEIIVDTVFSHALEIVAEKGEMMPVAFLVRIDEGMVIPLGLPFSDEREKHAAMMMLRLMAKKKEADCVVFMCEAWGKSVEKQEEAERIRDSGGRVRNEPDSYECMMVDVETYHGHWAAMPKLVINGKKRTYAPPQFRFLDGASGTLMNHLPPRDTVH